MICTMKFSHLLSLQMEFIIFALVSYNDGVFSWGSETVESNFKETSNPKEVSAFVPISSETQVCL